MTQKHVLTVDFKEIKALEVECRCRARFTIPVPKDALRPNVKCAACNELLWDGGDDATFQYVSGFLRMLSEAQRREKDGFCLGFSLNMLEKTSESKT